MTSEGKGRNIPYFVALLAEVALFHRHVLFSPGYLFPWDFRAVHLPLATFAAASLRMGEWPLWDPYTYCGTAFFANIQAASFYPPVLLATIVSNWFGPDSMPRPLAVAVALQIFFAGLCTFGLLRRLGAQRGAAFVAATVYQLGCFFAVHTEHMGAMHSASWIPLAWWCVAGLRERFRWRWLGLLALALAMSVLAGLPQVAVATFGSTLGLALLLSAFEVARRRLSIEVLGAWTWGLLLAAVQVIPTAQLTENSVAKYRADWLRTGGGIKLGALYSLFIPNYWNVFDLSKFRGPSDLTFLYLYCSMLGLALALAAMVWKPDRLCRAFCLLLIGATIWMLGDSTPVGRTIFQALPVNIRIGIHPEFTLPVFGLAIAVLAGLGANRLLRSRWQVAAGAIIALDLLLVSSGRPFNEASVKTEPGITHDALDGSVELAAKLRQWTAQAKPSYRFDMADAPYSWSGSGEILDIPTANGCDPMAPERTIQLRLSFAPGERWGTCYQVVNTTSPVIGLENARYVISRSPVQLGMLQPVQTIAGFTVYENNRVLPRYFLAGAVKTAAGLGEAARMLHAAAFDPAQAAIVEGDLSTGPWAPGSVQVSDYRPTFVRLRTHSEGPSFLVAADSWYPGWEATVDGQPARIYPADVAFRGIPLPPGDHTVEMRFVPRILYWSGAVSVLALIAALAAVISGRTSGRPDPEASDGTTAPDGRATP